MQAHIGRPLLLQLLLTVLPQNFNCLSPQERYLLRDIHPLQLGGPGVEVEIDESNSARINQMCACSCTRSFRPNPSAHYRWPLPCRKGTRIITDGWRTYNSLNHAVVNHNIQLIDPNDPTIHTNTVEGNWATIKTKYSNIHDNSDALWVTYFHEYCLLLNKKIF